MTRRELAATPLAAALGTTLREPIPVGNRRELFVDRFLIAESQGVELRLGAPLDAGRAIAFDQPWEGAFSGYSTVIHDAGRYLLYYRGVPSSGGDGRDAEVTCVAESADGRKFTRVKTADRNLVLAGSPPFSHNFSPFLDSHPAAKPSQRFKAIAGTHASGLHGFASEDGLRWTPVKAAPILPSPAEFAFDSQNIAFYSAHERCYVLYYRTWKKIGGVNYRWVSRASSDDFLNWRTEGEVDYGGAVPEHLYTNQTSPYFRAPHIYAAVCARFFPGRQVLTAEQAREVQVDAKYFKDCSDAVLVSSRGGRRFERTFMEAFLRPGLGFENWVSRSNYPALNLVPTGPAEMSFYVNRSYGQPAAHLERYALRLDGLASAHAGYAGGVLTTHPVTLAGGTLELNYATSAAGSVRVELLDAGSMRPLAATPELIGDEISRRLPLAAGTRPVRLRFHIKDADVYSFRQA